MRKKIILVLILALISCKKKETEPIAKPVSDFLETSDLYSKVFYISTHLNTENCTVYNYGCDCCDGKIVFLKNGTFISDFYCIPSETYTTGTFKIKNKKLILNYSKTEALFGPENEDDYEGKDILRLQTSESGVTILDIIRCKNHYIFKSESDYYAEHEKTTYSVALKEYKKSGVWQLLGLKG
jgi:hypothetical protein